MKLHTKTFDTEAEGRSFMEGVELVNDSDLSCHEPRFVGNQFVIYERSGIWTRRRGRPKDTTRHEKGTHMTHACPLFLSSLHQFRDGLGIV